MTRFRLFAKCQSLAVNNSRLFRRSRPLTDGKPVVSPFRLNSPSPRICLMPERPRSGQEIYFETVMANNPDYPEHHLICENTMKKRFTANKLVMAVRDLRSNDMGVTTVPQKFDFACKDYLEDSFSADDVIEILCKLRKGLLVLPSHLQQLKDVLILQIEHLMKKDDVPVNKLLTVLHLLKNLTQLSSVCDPLVQFFYENKSKLTGSQLTVYFHALHIYKNFPLHRCTEEFDSFLSHHLKSMSLENVAVIAFAFFRCLSKPGNMSCKVVAEKLRYHLEKCEHIRYETLTSICKFLQFAGSHALANDLYAISEVFIGKMEKYSLMTAIHVASANINVNNVNARLVELILEKTEINPDKLRLKDYERLFLSALFANIDLRKKKEFIEVVKKELEMRENDFMKYHISFISLLMHLISYGIYIDHLLSFALSQDYRSLTTTGSAHCILFIDATLEMERPDYRGNKLPKVERERLAKIVIANLESQTNTAALRSNNEIRNCLVSIYGESSCTMKCLLPHYNTMHPVLSLNKDMEPQEIGDKLKNSTGEIVRAPKDGNLWFCFVLVRRQGCLGFEAKPNLITCVKLKHFRLAGYVPLTVYHQVWCRMTDTKKMNTIKELLSSRINNPSFSQRTF